ncbi:ATP-dependent Clp protease adapter protein CLPS1, chloroplastic isoform X2 [Sesamum indicum]|uniref:ATP-dependent Clp protease adapter protein CLPS1, chloroplastic isoform X2 n=1 Tax=Sesamum indicum TaxID=4182 RepID=A0A6I9UF80_SESIN|nr:ATP-dependent Clp protease adapter protein CLPS1, chloroplastic isoform X2 [Sesamum indicum]
METVISCGRVALSPNQICHPTSGDRYPLHKQWANRSTLMIMPIAGQGKGGVLDKPIIEKTTPGRESEFDLRYGYQNVNQVLMKVIPGMTLDNAVNIMQEAHYNGLSVVIICAQADAEEHCMQLRGNGLLSSIEPASGGC